MHCLPHCLHWKENERLELKESNINNFLSLLNTQRNVYPYHEYTSIKTVLPIEHWKVQSSTGKSWLTKRKLGKQCSIWAKIDRQT